MYIVTIKKLKNEKVFYVKGKICKNVIDAMTYAKNVLKDIGEKQSFIFDGKGNIKTLKRYLKVIADESEYDEFNEEIKQLQTITKKIVLGEIIDNKEIYFEDGMIKAELKNGIFKLEGYDDGPINNITPCIETNFLVKKTSYYYFHINDNFGDYGNTDDISEIYIDIIKVEE